MSRTLWSVALSVAVSVMLLGVCSAQDAWTNPYTGGTWNNPISSFLDTTLWSRSMGLASGGTTEGQAAGTAPTTPSPALTYSPGPPVAPHALAEQLGQTAEQRRQLEDVFSEILKSYSEQAAADGRDHNLATAATFFVLCSYTVLHDGAEPSDAAQEALFAQMQQALGAQPELDQAADADKQSLAETLVLLGALPVVGLQQAAEGNDQATKDSMLRMAAQNLEALLHVQADGVTVSDAGLAIGAKATALTPEADGRVHVGRMSVVLPAGWTAQQRGEVLEASPEAAAESFVLLMQPPGESIYQTANERTFAELTGRDPTKVRRHDYAANVLDSGWVFMRELGDLGNGAVAMATALESPQNETVRTVAVAADTNVFARYRNEAFALLQSLGLTP